MMAIADGTPIWFELGTRDPDAAQGYYEKLAGWTVTASAVPGHGGYRLAANAAGIGVAGIMAPPPGTTDPDGWTIYFAAADVDAMAQQVTALGGQVAAGPMDIPQVGRFAAAADPQGIGFAIIAMEDGGDSGAFAMTGGQPGQAVWVELATPDPDAAFAFYGALFGWIRGGVMPMGEMGDYAFIGVDGQTCPAGTATGPGAVMSSSRTGAPAAWNWYVQVPDIDEAVATATADGGTVLQGPDEIPGGRYSANIADPAGHRIGIVGPRN